MLNLNNFYQSKDWIKFRDIVINDRIKEDGFIYDEVTGKPIVNRYDIILHHTIFLNDQNVNDRSISLNPDLIQIVSHKTHNQIHNKLGYQRQEVYLVYGSPLSGKSTYVESVREPGDLILDMDRIWQCFSGEKLYEKPPRLNSVIFGVRDYILESIRIRRGKWQNAYVIGGYPLSSERERLCRSLGAREIYIDSTKEQCLLLLENDGERDKKLWTEYIESWWERYIPPPP